MTEQDDTIKQPIATLPSAQESGSKPLSANQYGLNDSHLGPPNENGVRPILPDGYTQMLKSQAATPQPIQLPQIGQNQQNQSNGQQGILGGMLNNAINQGISNSALGQSLQSGISGGISSILNFL